MFAIGDVEWPGISKLLEEAGEVSQVCGKLMGSHGDIDHWDGTDLRSRLIEELADLKAAIEFVVVHNKLDATVLNERVISKIHLFEKWHVSQSP